PWRFDGHFLFRAWMIECDPARVQHLARRRVASRIAHFSTLLFSVNFIAEYWKSKMLKMDPDLVCASRKQDGFNQRRVVQQFNHSISGMRFPSRFLHGHSFAMARVACNGCTDVSTRTRHF